MKLRPLYICYRSFFIAYAEGKWGSRIRAYILSGGGTSEWYEYDRGRTSRNKDASWVKWCEANGVRHGTAVPDIDFFADDFATPGTKLYEIGN